MTEQKMMDVLLSALGRQAEQAEVYAVESESTQITFEAAELKSSLVEETSGVALRGIVGGRVGFSAASGRVDPAALVERAVASARYGEPLALAFPGRLPAPEVVTYDPHLAEVPLERVVALGREIIERLRAAEPAGKIDVEIERSAARSWLRNSAGAEVEQVASALHISMGMERVRGDDVLMVGESTAETGLSDGFREVVDRLTARILAANRTASVDSGTMPVLFAPSGALVLLLPLLMAVNGQQVQRGTSPLASRLGEQILDPRLTLWDDPTLPGRPASAAYDDEGVPVRRKALFRAGVAESFLYDLKTAALMGVESTGNGARSLFSLPAPSATNLVLEPGDTPLDTMIAGIAHGLFVDGLLGLGQGNPLSGAFSNPVGLAYVIEDGQIVGRVKDLTLAGNVYDLLKGIGGLSREQHWVHGRYLLPHILLPEVNVVRSR
jgi:PmbA protein